MVGTYLDLITAIRNGDSKTALKIIDTGYEKREMGHRRHTRNKRHLS